MNTSKKEMISRELDRGRTLLFTKRKYLKRIDTYYCLDGRKQTSYSHIDHILPYIYKHWNEMTIYR